MSFIIFFKKAGLILRVNIYTEQMILTVQNGDLIDSSFVDFMRCKKKKSGYLEEMVLFFFELMS